MIPGRINIFRSRIARILNFVKTLPQWSGLFNGPGTNVLPGTAPGFVGNTGHKTGDIVAGLYAGFHIAISGQQYACSDVLHGIAREDHLFGVAPEIGKGGFVQFEFFGLFSFHIYSRFYDSKAGKNFW
jgi:hypothetical protein